MKKKIITALLGLGIICMLPSTGSSLKVKQKNNVLLSNQVSISASKQNFSKESSSKMQKLDLDMPYWSYLWNRVYIITTDNKVLNYEYCYGYKGMRTGLVDGYAPTGYELVGISVNGKLLSKKEMASYNVPEVLESNLLVDYIVKPIPKHEAKVEAILGNGRVESATTVGVKGTKITYPSIPTNEVISKIIVNGKEVPLSDAPKVLGNENISIKIITKPKMPPKKIASINISTEYNGKVLYSKKYTGYVGEGLKVEKPSILDSYYVKAINFNNKIYEGKDLKSFVLPDKFSSGSETLTYILAKKEVPKKNAELSIEYLYNNTIIYSEDYHGKIGDTINIKKFDVPKAYTIQSIIVNNEIYNKSDLQKFILPTKLTNSKEVIKYILDKSVEEKGNISKKDSSADKGLDNNTANKNKTINSDSDKKSANTDEKKVDKPKISSGGEKTDSTTIKNVDYNTGNTANKPSDIKKNNSKTKVVPKDNDDIKKDNNKKIMEPEKSANNGSVVNPKTESNPTKKVILPVVNQPKSKTDDKKVVVPTNNVDKKGVADIKKDTSNSDSIIPNVKPKANNINSLSNIPVVNTLSNVPAINNKIDMQNKDTKKKIGLPKDITEPILKPRIESESTRIENVVNDVKSKIKKNWHNTIKTEAVITPANTESEDIVNSTFSFKLPAVDGGIIRANQVTQEGSKITGANNMKNSSREELKRVGLLAATAIMSVISAAMLLMGPKGK